MEIKEFYTKIKAHAETMRQTVKTPFNISDILNEREDIKMRKNSKSSLILKRTACTAAGAAVAFTAVFNCAPNLAYAVSDVPVLGRAVKIVTLGRFELHENGYDANVVTPQIEGLLDKELENRLNSDFKENADMVISAFEEDIKELKSEFGEDTIHLGLEANYTVRTDNEDVLAIDTYILTTAGSSSTKHSFYNIDKKSGTLITLPSLFKSDADYVTPISDYILSEMKKQNADGTGYYMIDGEEAFADFEHFEKIKPEQNFFINEDGEIVICFDKYEVAAGAQGCPEFVIPIKIISNILK